MNTIEYKLNANILLYHKYVVSVVSPESKQKDNFRAVFVFTMHFNKSGIFLQNESLFYNSEE